MTKVEPSDAELLASADTGPTNDGREYRWPDGASVTYFPGHKKWGARWAGGLAVWADPQSGVSLSYFDTPEEPARLLYEAGEGPAVVMGRARETSALKERVWSGWEALRAACRKQHKGGPGGAMMCYCGANCGTTTACGFLREIRDVLNRVELDAVADPHARAWLTVFRRTA